MDKTFMLAAFALICAASFAQGTYEECSSVEQLCIKDCCESAGGIPTTSGGAGGCEGKTESDTAGAAAYLDCTASICRPALIYCAAPYTSCGDDYTSCYNSCKAGGQDTVSCDATCFGPATTCVEDYRAGKGSASTTSGGSSCCGSGFLLGFALLGAFAASKNQVHFP